MTLTALPTPTAEDLARLEAYDPGVRQRGMIEMALCRKLVQTLVAANYLITVDDGGDEGDEPVKDGTDERAIMDAIFAVEECRLYVRKPINDGSNGWVYIVLGNTGWDSISDHTTNLEEVLGPVNEYADQLSEWC